MQAQFGMQKMLLNVRMRHEDIKADLSATAWAHHRWEGCVEAVVENRLEEVSKTAALYSTKPIDSQQACMPALKEMQIMLLSVHVTTCTGEMSTEEHGLTIGGRAVWRRWRSVGGRR